MAMPVQSRTGAWNSLNSASVMRPMPPETSPSSCPCPAISRPTRRLGLGPVRERRGRVVPENRVEAQQHDEAAADVRQAGDESGVGLAAELGRRLDLGVLDIDDVGDLVHEQAD